MVFAYSSWDERTRRNDVPVACLHDQDHREIACFPTKLTGSDVAWVGDAQWQIGSEKTELSATLPSGERLLASTGGKSWGRAKELEINLSGRTVTAVNEAGADWVYVDESDTKIGQFSGGNNGVRRSITEFEAPEVHKLTEDQQVFLSWVTRMTLEAKLSTTSMILIGSLLLVIPVVLVALL